MINFIKKKIIKTNDIYKMKQGIFSLIKKLLFKCDPLSLETVKVLSTVAVKLSFSRVFVFPGHLPFALHPAPAPNLYLPALAPNFITSPGPEFCIYRPCLLNLYLYLRPLSTICITGPGL